MNEGIKKVLVAIGIVLGICIASIALLLSIGHFAKKKMAQVASEKLLKEVVRESVKEEHKNNKSKSESKGKKASKESVEEEVQEILDIALALKRTEVSVTCHFQNVGFFTKQSRPRKRTANSKEAHCLCAKCKMMDCPHRGNSSETCEGYQKTES